MFMCFLIIITVLLKVKKPDGFIVKNANCFYFSSLNYKAINLLLGIATLVSDVVSLK